jgi:hypothetical protein
MILMEGYDITHLAYMGRVTELCSLHEALYSNLSAPRMAWLRQAVMIGPLFLSAAFRR